MSDADQLDTIVFSTTRDLERLAHMIRAELNRRNAAEQHQRGREAATAYLRRMTSDPLR